MMENNKLGYEDWDKVVNDCDAEFKRMQATRKNMNLAEQIQKKIKSFAIGERRKFPEPAPKPETPADISKTDRPIK